MTIYLYVKTHNKTGLKYLGKTVSKDPHKYTGSGVNWKIHLKEYGFDYSTEILKECCNADELKKWGMYYSQLWNVAESMGWANLIEEAGPGGRWSEQSKQKLSNTTKHALSKLSQEDKITRVKNSCCRPDSYTKDRSVKISNALTGLQRSDSNKLNNKLSSLAYQASLSTAEKQQIYGSQNAGKTWKLINGNRVWLKKEN